MKAILISDHAKWCALMMNGIKKIEVRKGTALYKATQKLIDEYGYAEFYVYCTKDKKDFLVNADLIRPPFPHPRTYMLGHKDYSLNGKVIFKFRCYKVEEMRPFFHWCIEEETCLTRDDVLDYLDSKNKSVGNPKRQGKVYAINISDLEIFDKPKELSEFKRPRDSYGKVNWNANEYYYMELTKAPQSWQFIEVVE